jgi:hypothetical protein
VIEHLPNKHKGLDSMPSTKRKKKKMNLFSQSNFLIIQIKFVVAIATFVAIINSVYSPFHTNRKIQRIQACGRRNLEIL